MTSRKSGSLDDILPLLHAGEFGRAIPQLQALTRQDPPDPEVYFNLGLALSDTQQLPEAIVALKRCIDLQPLHQPAWVGLGVAYARREQYELSREALSRALELKPDDQLTLSNLSGIVGHLGDHEASVDLARRAARARPDDPAALFNLATALRDQAGSVKSEDQARELRGQAADAFKLFLERFPDSTHAERARQSLTLIAETSLRKRGGLGAQRFRVDVFEYIVDALKMFEEMGDARRNLVVFEIAKVGSGGLDINSPERKFAIKGLPGNYTALQLVSFMYTGMQQLNPSIDSGVDFSLEYKAAMESLGRTAADSSPGKT